MNLRGLRHGKTLQLQEISIAETFDERQRQVEFVEFHMDRFVYCLRLIVHRMLQRSALLRQEIQKAARI